MAYTGQIIENPVSGERITFLQTAADTAGELLEFELELAPDGHVPGAHVHPEQEERFHVLDGDDEVPPWSAAHRRPARATPSSSPPASVHRFANGGDDARRAAASRSSPRSTWSSCSRPPSSSPSRAT